MDPPPLLRECPSFHSSPSLHCLTLWLSLFTRTPGLQNVTDGKGTPDWVSSDDLKHLGRLADFSMTLMYNTVEKKRLSAGKSNCGLVYMRMFMACVWREIREMEREREK